MTACLDSGPWPCAESGCPTPTIDCALLAQEGVCGRLFSAMWKTPPEGMADEKIADHCRLSCDKCTVVEHHQPWCAAIDGCVAVNKEYDELEHGLSVGIHQLPLHGPRLRKSVQPGEGVVQMGVLHNDSRALEIAQGITKLVFPNDADAMMAAAVGLARKGDSAAVKAFEDVAKLLLTSGSSPSVPRHAATRPGNFEALRGTLGGGGAAAKADADADDGGDDGGWGGGACPATCAFDVRGAELTLDEFEEVYVRGGRPVVVPLSSVVGGADADATAGAWRRDEMLRVHGDAEVAVTWTAQSLGRQTVKQVVNADGSVTEGAMEMATTETLTLRAFLEDHMPPTPAAAGVNGTAADGADIRYVLTGKALPDLLAASSSSAAAEGEDGGGGGDGPLLASKEFMPDARRLLSLGPKGSGHYFRFHMNAFFALRHGCQRHVLLPPAASFRTAAQDRARRAGVDAWLADARDPHFFPFAPLECVARGGAAVFVPSGWSHMVVHEQHTVSMVLEMGDVKLDAALVKSAEESVEAIRAKKSAAKKPVAKASA